MNRIDNISEDTIVACSTATAVRSGVAIVRLSGSNCRNIAKKISGKREFKERVATFCAIDTGEVRDETIVICFKEPNSYTGEDMVEIHCHGNPLIVSGIIKFCVNNGARVAQAGEFTKRAYLNGKADLTAAEAVADIISAETQMQLNSAMRLREGGLFKEIEKLQNEIYDLIAELNAAIDYPEEDIEEPAALAVKTRAANLAERINAFASTYNSGRLIKDGVRVAIFGAPNVGKSSILNRLLGKERAIVTPIAGTTRDTVEDRYEYNGIIFIITDTAGIRETNEAIERQGIERACAAVRDCDIVLAVADENGEWPEVPQGKSVIFIRNKIDIVRDNTAKNSVSESQKYDITTQTLNEQEKKDLSPKDLISKDSITKDSIAKADSELTQTPPSPFVTFVTKDSISKADSELTQTPPSPFVIIEVSALENTNIDKIKQKLYDISCGDLNYEGFILTNLRHYEAVNAAADFLKAAVKSAEYETPEIISVDLSDAANELGKVTGIIGSDEVVKRIFSKFCVGK